VDILIIRHAEAVSHSAPVEDAYRPLTPRGRRDAKRLGKLLRAAEARPDVIVFSPLVRAVQTAELVARGLRYKGPLDVAPELAPERKPPSVVREVLLPRAELACVALVGHEPLLGELLGLLLKAPAPPLPKAAAVLVAWSGPEEAGRVAWAVKAGMDEPAPDLTVFQ
jgi:phosphohistidine phosphatase